MHRGVSLSENPAMDLDSMSEDKYSRVGKWKRYMEHSMDPFNMYPRYQLEGQPSELVFVLEIRFSKCMLSASDW